MPLFNYCKAHARLGGHAVYSADINIDIHIKININININI